jgi:hypothetical protein
MRTAPASVLVLGVAATFVVSTAAPAVAHGNPGIEPANYQVRVRALTPNVDDVQVRPVDLGQLLELSNDSDEPIDVLNSEGKLTVRVPPGETRRWHEHRAVWNGAPPPVVERDPDRRHVVRTWEVNLRRVDETIVVTGDTVWVPPPSPWPWVALAIALGGVLVVASRAPRWRGAVAAALAVTVTATAVQLIARWSATTESVGTKLATDVYGIAGIVLGTTALVWLVRSRDPEAATPGVLVAGVVLVIAGGLAHVGILGHSQVATTLAPSVARLAVAATLGFGAGLVVAAAWRLRPPGARPRAQVGGRSPTS